MSQAGPTGSLVLEPSRYLTTPSGTFVPMESPSVWSAQVGPFFPSDCLKVSCPSQNDGFSHEDEEECWQLLCRYKFLWLTQAGWRSSFNRITCLKEEAALHRYHLNPSSGTNLYPNSLPTSLPPSSTEGTNGFYFFHCCWATICKLYINSHSPTSSQESNILVIS